MPDYTKGKIYCIRSHKTDQVYVGSTTNTLSRRMAQHRSQFKRQMKDTTSFEILKYADAYIELIEIYPCSCMAELNKREGHFIRSMNCANKIIAGRTMKEWRQDNKEHLVVQQKQYYIDNKERLAANHTKYKQDNKERLVVQQKVYQVANREKINEWYRKKIVCACGSTVNHSSKSRHRKTNKHKLYLAGLITQG